MNAAVYSEPYKFPAGVLALAVHLAFFALLYFGVSWHSDPPQGMTVDIWNSLPVAQPEPVKAVEPPPEPLPPPPEPAPEPPAPPPRRADIELGEKKKPKAPPIVKPVVPKPKVAPPPAAVEQTRAVQSEQEKARLAQAAAEGKVVDDYKSRIKAKIKSYIFMPQNVADDAQAEFDVTLLPGGTVLSARKTKPSGNDAYDAAVERAIWRAQPLPLPSDTALFNRFRELHLTFKPKE